MEGRIIGVGVICFISGLAVAFAALYSRTRAQEEHVAATRRSLNDTREEVASLRSENTELQGQLARLAAADEERIAKQKTATIAKLNAVIQSRKDIFPMSLQLIDHHGAVDEIFTQIFDLTPQERARINGILESARARLAELERQNVHLERTSDHVVKLRADPFPKEGGRVYDESLAAISNTLGPDRYKAFVALSAEGLEHSLSSFGARERTMTITYDPKSALYTVEDRYDMGTGYSTSTSRWRDKADLKRQLGILAPLLPERDDLSDGG